MLTLTYKCMDRLLKVRKKLGTCHELVALIAKLLSAEHRTSTVNKRPPTIAAVPQKKTSKKGEGQAYRIELDSRDWGGGTTAGRGARSNRNNSTVARSWRGLSAHPTVKFRHLAKQIMLLFWLFIIL
jgi:hypothetical protein